MLTLLGVVVGRLLPSLERLFLAIGLGLSWSRASDDIHSLTVTEDKVVSVPLPSLLQEARVTSPDLEA